MDHVIKTGDTYLVADGSWSLKQADALRVVTNDTAMIRIVELKPKAPTPTDDTPTT